MSKRQYSETMKEVTGISEDDAQELGLIPRIIANSSEAGLRLLQVQFKVFNAYIEKRLEVYSTKANKSTS